jgi:hypothetical protein
VQHAVVKGRVEVELVEEVGGVVELGLLGIVLNDVLEGVKELSLVHEFFSTNKLTDDVLEFVIDDDHSVAILGALDDLAGDGGNYIRRNVPVGKLRGVWIFVMANSIMSGKNLDRATEPLSPTENIL